MDTTKRRLELLKMEGSGFNQTEIVKELSEKFQCTKRTVYYDYQRRTYWQPQLLELDNQKLMFLKAVNRVEQIYRKASFIHLATANDSAKVGALKVMLDSNSRLIELLAVDASGAAPGEIKLSWQEKEIVDKQMQAAYDEFCESMTPEEDKMWRSLYSRYIKIGNKHRGAMARSKIH